MRIGGKLTENYGTDRMMGVRRISGKNGKQKSLMWRKQIVRTKGDKKKELMGEKHMSLY